MKAEGTDSSPEAIGRQFAEALGSKFRRNHLVAPFTFTNLGGPAEYLFVADSVEELLLAARTATSLQVPYIVIGAGSGVLASDVGFPGLIIINRTNRIMFDVERSQAVVDAGVATDYLLNVAAARGLGSLEFLSAVPGTVGGAVATNAGWERRHILSAVKEVILYVPGQGETGVVTVPSKEIMVEPLHRLFPESVIQSPVILSLRLQFARIDPAEIVRRLFELRRYRQVQLKAAKLGHIFTKPLTAGMLDKNQLSTFKRAGIVVDHASNVIRFGRTQPNPRSLGRAIKAIGSSAGGEHGPLEERLHFLGYWPDEDGENTEHTPNT